MISKVFSIKQQFITIVAHMTGVSDNDFPEAGVRIKHRMSHGEDVCLELYYY